MMPGARRASVRAVGADGEGHDGRDHDEEEHQRQDVAAEAGGELQVAGDDGEEGAHQAGPERQGLRRRPTVEIVVGGDDGNAAGRAMIADQAGRQGLRRRCRARRWARRAARSGGGWRRGGRARGGGSGPVRGGRRRGGRGRRGRRSCRRRRPEMALAGAVEVHPESEVFGQRQPRLHGVEVAEEVERGARPLVPGAHLDRPRFRPQDAGEGQQQAGLARAVGSTDQNHAARLNG